ncbi:hypothetical protein WICMUC_004445 [Wickerhamomyces mucosus]|uniref:Uncharacterized protein n=1 Tax=Wickerhamomyces mucosus TaxID=1378264 RepID=A0A9P8TB76_9ASCO|nr:hypothetical protein WICMUC_004445 [Wickerhamomyces mucosus]
MDIFIGKLKDVDSDTDVSNIKIDVLSLVVSSHLSISSEIESKIQTIEQLDKLIDSLFEQPLKFSVITSQIAIQISQLYVTLLTKEPNNLFNSTNKFITMINTDDSKNANNRLLSTNVLTVIYQNFGKDLTSFIPLLITNSLKQIKEHVNSNTISYAHAQLLVTVVKLLYTLNKNNDHSSLLSDSNVTKYIKLLSKVKFNRQLWGKLYEIFGELTIFNYHHTDLVLYKKTYLTYIIGGFTNEISNVPISKSLSNVLAKFETHQIIKLYHDIYEESLSDVFLSIIDLFGNSAHLNENFDEFFREILIFLSNSTSPMEQLTFVVEAITNKLSESSRIIQFDRLYKFLDKTDGFNEAQIFLILNSLKLLLNNLLNLNDLEVEKYQISFVKLSLSSGPSTQKKAASTLTKFASNFPLVLPQLAENFFNEVKNNSTNLEIFQKTYGSSLIIASLIKASTEGSISNDFVSHVWKFSSNHIKTKNDKFTECSWILLNGVFSYHDQEFLHNLIDGFKIIWLDDDIQNLRIKLETLNSFLENVGDLDSNTLNYIIDSLLKLKSRLKDTETDLEIESWIFKIFHIIATKYYQKSPSAILIQSIYNFLNYDELSSFYHEFQKSEHLDGWITSYRYQLIDNSDLIDSSIGIFISNFPIISEKIQLSLIELLRTFVSSSSAKDRVNLSINIAIALNGALKSQKIKLNEVLKSHLFDILSLIYQINPNETILALNSDSIGLLVSKNDSKVNDIDVIIGKIISKDDADLRCFNISILDKIYKYSHQQFQKLFEVLIRLIQDSNPKVHFYALRAMAGLIENHVVLNQAKGEELLQILGKIIVSNEFGKFNENYSFTNLNIGHDSQLGIVRLIKVLVINLGPNLKIISNKSELLNILTSVLFNTDNSELQLYLLQIFNELLIFDPELFPLKFTLSYLKNLMINNLRDYNLGSNTYFQFNLQVQNIQQPLNSNHPVLKYTFKFLLNFLKINPDFQFSNFENLFWISLELYPESIELKEILSNLIELTPVSNLLEKLLYLFSVSRTKLLLPFEQFRTQIDSKYQSRSTKSQETKDEESQSINKITEEGKSDGVNWIFKHLILESIISILQVSTNNELSQISHDIESLIKISFYSSTSSNLKLRLTGIKLLETILEKFSDFQDPIYPQFSLLQQQQAQIVSAIIPAFGNDSNPDIVGYAIQVIGKFIGSGITKLSKLDRLVKVLKQSLDDLLNYNYKINDLSIINDESFKRLQRSILNSWADLKILKKQQDLELNQLINENLEKLIPLWISFLKDSIIKGEDEIKLLRVIGILVRENQGNLIENALGNDNILEFYFIVYCKCLELISKTHYCNNNNNNNNEEIFLIFQDVLNFPNLINFIVLDDLLFEETFEILQRLIVTNFKSKILIIAIIYQFFQKIHRIDSNQIDKLFKLNYLLTFPLSSNDLILIKISFNKLLELVDKFPEFMVVDILQTYQQLLIQFQQEFTLSIHKQILIKLKDLNRWDIINKSYQYIQFNNSIYSLLLFTIYINIAGDNLKIYNKDEIISIVENQLNENLNDEVLIRSLKTIILKSSNSILYSLSLSLLKIIILQNNNINDEILNQNKKIGIELYILLIKINPKLSLFQILIPILINFKDYEYSKNKLNLLIELNQNYVKQIINKNLSDLQKQKIKSILS